MHPTLRARLSNLVKHNDPAAILAMLPTAADPAERTQIEWAARHVERSRRHRERHTTGATIDLNPGR